jgi:hypothetical protein
MGFPMLLHGLLILAQHTIEILEIYEDDPQYKRALVALEQFVEAIEAIFQQPAISPELPKSPCVSPPSLVRSTSASV